jgi:protein-arginine kinase
MQKGGNVNEVFERLARLINEVEKTVNAKGKTFAVHKSYGFISTCPTNLGTGMRASVMVHLPGWTKDRAALRARCEELGL